MNFNKHNGRESTKSENMYGIAQFCCVLVMTYGVVVIGLAQEGNFKRIALGLFIAFYGAVCALLNRFGAHVDRLVYREVHTLEAHSK